MRAQSISWYSDLELNSRHPEFSNIERLCDAGHRVLVHSHLVHDEVILTCLDMGASADIAKNEGRAHLVAASCAIADGDGYVGPRMANAMAKDIRHGRPELTPREREVLIAWFQTENKDLVGKRLYLSPSTVNTYLQRIRRRYAAAVPRQAGPPTVKRRCWPARCKMASSASTMFDSESPRQPAAPRAAL